MNMKICYIKYVLILRIPSSNQLSGLAEQSSRKSITKSSMTKENKDFQKSQQSKNAKGDLLLLVLFTYKIQT